MSSMSVTGSGFDHLSSRLPTNAKACFSDLAMVDHVIAHTHMNRLQSVDLDLLITIRDTAHHRLLMLTAWDDNVSLAWPNVNYVVYECCRLASIIYVHCVLSPVLQGCSGVLQPLAELAELLSREQVRFDDEDLRSLFAWSLFVGCLAGFRTHLRGFFTARLRELVLTLGIDSLHHALAMCRTFIWSDPACMQGASVIWDYVGPQLGDAAPD